MNKWWFDRIWRKVLDQICSLMETTIRQRAGERGLPMGLPRHWRTHRLPRAKVCMFNADLIRSGTCLMTIFRVTLRRRKVRPLMMSPGLLDFPGYTEKTSSSYTFIFERRKSRSMNHDRINLSWSMLVKKPARSWLTRMRSASTGASRRMDNRVYTSPVAKWSGQADGMS